MILPFPDIKARQKELATKFIKDSRESFAGKKKNGYLLIAWGDDEVSIATYDTYGISIGELEDYIDSALDSLCDERED